MHPDFTAFQCSPTKIWSFDCLRRNRKKRLMYAEFRLAFRSKWTPIYFFPKLNIQLLFTHRLVVSCITSFCGIQNKVILWISISLWITLKFNEAPKSVSIKLHIAQWSFHKCLLSDIDAILTKIVRAFVCSPFAQSCALKWIKWTSSPWTSDSSSILIKIKIWKLSNLATLITL